MQTDSPESPPCGSGCGSAIETLNRVCFCRTVDQTLLRQQLLSEQPDADLYEHILATRPHLFSNTAVFLSQRHALEMRSLIEAVDQVVATPAYQQHVMGWARPISGRPFGPLGACMGFDFHLGPDGPQLIEINTNAGGAWLNAALARAQTPCCANLLEDSAAQPSPSSLENRLFAMFRDEWALQRGDAPLETVAIVDDSPTEQYLYPEFRLAARMFLRHGVRAVIADAGSLRYAEGRLWHEGTPIDLVYNRLTDFTLESPDHVALRNAYEAGAVVVTPNPHTYALYADKRNLTALTDEKLLRQWQTPEPTISTLLRGIPHTVAVTPENADALWQQRRHFFFKPASGYGSKAAYRGDKLTKRVWTAICEDAYVAQSRIPPSERGVLVDGEQTTLKVDLRNYVYAGDVQLIAARLYQGQTTNFRTPGGGFASVFV